jgi:ribonuclease VapC
VIVVDTSALMAILLGEPEAEACMAVLEAEDDLLISAGTVAEALIVASRKGIRAEMESLIDGFGFEIADVTPPAARRIADAHARWGKGARSAALNFGDCFAYEVAARQAARLLYVGDDFARTDVASALPRRRPQRRR